MTAKTPTYESDLKNVGAQFRFEALDQPGTYVSNWSGHLIRVPEEALRKGHSPVLEIKGREPMVVTKLSNDPYVPISKARMIAADFDLEVDF